MGIGALDYKKGGSNFEINGIIKDYYVYAGEKVSAGDFVEFINGLASKIDYGKSTAETLSSTGYSGFYHKAVKLDANRVFIAHSDSSYKLYGVVITINGIDITVGTDTLLSSLDDSGMKFSVELVADNKIFIAHCYGAKKHLYSTICTIDGTIITKGTYTMLTEEYWSGYEISTQLLEDGRVFVAHNYGNAYWLSAMICTIEGTSITPSTDTIIIEEHSGGYAISTVTLTGNNIFIAHSKTANFGLYGIVCTVSGTTISKGTDTTLESGKYAGYAISTELLKNGNIFIAHSRTTNYDLNGIVCSVSGTSITHGSDTTLDNTYYSGVKISAIQTSNEDIFVAYANNQSNLYGMVCKVSGTTISSLGEKVHLNTAVYPAGEVISALLLEKDLIFLSYGDNLNTRNLQVQMFVVDKENIKPTDNITIIEYETQVRPTTSLPCNGVAKNNGVGGDDTGHKDIVSVYVNNV